MYLIETRSGDRHEDTCCFVPDIGRAPPRGGQSLFDHADHASTDQSTDHMHDATNRFSTEICRSNRPRNAFDAKENSKRHLLWNCSSSVCLHLVSPAARQPTLPFIMSTPAAPSRQDFLRSEDVRNKYKDQCTAQATKVLWGSFAVLGAASIGTHFVLNRSKYCCHMVNDIGV